MLVPPHEVYNPYEYNRTQSAGNQIVFGKAADERYQRDAYDPNAYEESKAVPVRQSYDKYEQYASGQAEQPPSRGRAVQLPIQTKDYGAFRGGAAEGAGIGMGYSKPLQAPTKDFAGGAGTKFY